MFFFWTSICVLLGVFLGTGTASGKHHREASQGLTPRWFVDSEATPTTTEEASEASEDHTKPLFQEAGT